MFINTSIFKKLIKEAYNAYMLMVGATEYEYFISNGAWIICVNKDDFTKKEKAAVIELIGELPDIGQAFKAGKDAPNQYEISKTVIRDIWGGFADCKCDVSVTRSVYQTEYGMYQVMQHKETGKCFFVNKRIIDMIEPKVITETENTPIGPRALNNKSNLLYWKNNSMAMMVAPVELNESDKNGMEYLTLLENMVLPKI